LAEGAFLFRHFFEVQLYGVLNRLEVMDRQWHLSRMEAFPKHAQLKQSLSDLRRQKRTLVRLFHQFNKVKGKLSPEDATVHYELYGDQIHRVTKQIETVEFALQNLPS
jgi:hypothetical protein